MEIAFQSRPIRTICENDTIAKDKFGVEIAKKLRSRLSDLRSATSIDDLIVGNPQFVEKDNDSFLLIELVQNFRMVIIANHPNNPTLKSGHLDWSNVTRIKILRIESNYD